MRKMTLEIVQANIEDEPILQRLLELYQYDFSEFNDADVNVHGRYGYQYLDRYWTELGRYAYLIKVSGELAGFALIRNVDTDDGVFHSIAEFFIMRKYRRQGIGSEVALQLFERFPGEWRIYQEVDNLPAQSFWRKVVSEYTQDQFDFVEEDGWKNPIIKFEVSEGEN